MFFHFVVLSSQCIGESRARTGPFEDDASVHFRARPEEGVEETHRAAQELAEIEGFFVSSLSP